MKGIDFQVHANGATALPLYTDRVKLEQILGNLISNAIKFTSKGSRVEVHADTTPDALQLAVRDTGPGIPRDKQQALFDGYTQVYESGPDAEKGTGLGLWITRLLGGTISVDSTPDEGTTFSVMLPRTVVEKDAAA